MNGVVNGLALSVCRINNSRLEKFNVSDELVRLRSRPRDSLTAQFVPVTDNRALRDESENEVNKLKNTRRVNIGMCGVDISTYP